jgi:HSP20 family protein
MLTWYVNRPRLTGEMVAYRPMGFNGGRRLPIDVRADSEAFEITAAVPGLKAEDVQIEILDDILTLRGKVEVVESEGSDYLVREVGVGDFERSLRLPDPVDTTKAEASIRDGILTVRIPKAEAAKPKVIKVKGL